MSRSPMKLASALWKADYPMCNLTSSELRELKSILPLCTDHTLSPNLCSKVSIVGDLGVKLTQSLDHKFLPSFLIRQGYLELQDSYANDPVKYYIRYIWVVKLINYNNTRIRRWRKQHVRPKNLARTYSC